MTLPMIPSAGSDTAKNAECKAVIGSDGKITLEGMEAGMFLNLSIKASFSCKTNGSTATPLRTGKRWTEDSGGGEGSVIDYYTNKTRYVQLVAYNAQNQVVGGSDIYSFYTSIWTNNFTLSPVYNATVKRVDGTYNKQGDGSYFFNSTSYPFTIENLEYTDGMYFKLVEKVAFDIYSDFNNAYELYDEDNNAVSISQYYFTLYNDSVELDYGKGKSWKITKKVILNSEHTPCDYLLSYCKLFNLFIEKDRCEKTIHIRKYSTFYTGEEVDIQDKIDRSKPISIKPITFDSKWYEFGYPKDDEVEFLQKYKNVYGSDYGKQRVNTGYNFNSEKKDVFKSLVFKNGLDVLEKSRYFRYKTYEFRQRECPTFLFTPVKYTLFNSNMETYDVTLSSPPIYSTSGFNGNADYYDAFSKVQLHKSDNEPINGSDVLVFFNGFVKPTGKGVLGSWTPLYYNITDDLPEMIAMNEKPCWIYTISANNSAGQRIAYRFTELPHFSRMIISNSYISKSWDIGKPRELFVPTARYGDVANIYGHHWSLYVSELYDIDTRVVDCYVKLSVGDLKDALRKFYWFDDSLWILTKISDFNYSSSETTKCTFVKVKNTYAY